MLLLAPIPHSNRRWRVAEDWTAHGVTVPAGFDTDLASFPRVVEPIMHRNSWCWIAAGVLHDHAYRTHYSSRADADELLRSVAVAEGAPRWRARVVWLAVRLFGWRAWHQ